MKFLRVVCVLAMALCLTASVYAETQSVKVSGDLTIRGIWRDSYDYRGSTPERNPSAPAVQPRTGMTADTGVPGTPQSFWMSTTEVQIDADLTDNVATCIRILNERDWNVQRKVGPAGAAGGTTDVTSVFPNGLGGYNPNADEFDIKLDLAYVALKNFIYSPLTVTIGRQDLWFGKGFIVGSNHVFNNWVTLGNSWGLNAPEYTATTAFDSVKAVLDYDPWTITGVYSQLWNNAVAVSDNVELWGANVGYKFDSYKAEAEAYWFYKYDHSVEKWAAAAGNNDVSTIGLRGSVDPIDCITLAAEGAYQFGSYVGNRTQLQERDRSAWALDLSAEWRYLADRFSWKPKLGVEYILYSGEEASANPNLASGTYNGWDPMFRGKFDSAIREFVGSYYASYDYQGAANRIPSTQDASFTNQQQMIFSGSVQPIESLTLKGNANLFWTVEDYIRADNTTFNGGYIGTEFDLQAIWDYTEDVSFGLLCAWFMPYGSDIYYNADKVASDVVGTVKVSF